jgi:hypothetical protein
LNEELSKMLASDIDTAIEGNAEYPHRWHLGASIIGQSCLRKTWYAYRWCVAETFSARMLRLFQRGHREEPRFAEMLTMIGATVQLEVGGSQGRFTAISGHFGGSCDGTVTLPAKYNISTEVLAEFKTKATGAAFTKMKREGVALANPQHWAQICTYGNAFHLNHYLYMVVNKNDDDLHIEIGDIDTAHGVEMTSRARYIIASQTAPARMSDNPTHWQCKFCPAHGVCHTGVPLDKNCRSCKHASPVANAEWRCGLFGNVIPRDFVKTGCERWEPVA